MGIFSFILLISSKLNLGSVGGGSGDFGGDIINPASTFILSAKPSLTSLNNFMAPFS